MIQTDAIVTDIGDHGPFVRVALNAPEIAPGLVPGCFVLADLGGTLRAPLFPAWIGDGEFAALVPPDHPAAALRAGATVNLIGPLGRGFEVPPVARRLLLVADTLHLPALLALASRTCDFFEKLEVSVALLLAASTAADLYPVQLLAPALEIHVVTADGSAGRRGAIFDLFPDLVRWADCVCAACDPAAYPALAEVVREARVHPGKRFAQALVAPPLVCGVGACQGCAVQTARGLQLACTDGPVFDLLELR